MIKILAPIVLTAIVFTMLIFFTGIIYEKVGGVRSYLLIAGLWILVIGSLVFSFYVTKNSGTLIIVV